MASAFGAALLLAALTVIAVYAETARVTVLLPPHQAQTNVTLSGSRGSSYFPTRHISVQISESIQSPASAVTVGTFATGQVVFRGFNGCTGFCDGLTYTAPAGLEVLTAPGVAYKTLATVRWKANQTSPPVAVRAVVAGPSGNTGPNTVTRIKVSTYLMVTNPKPISGGTGRNTHMVLKSDFDSAIATLHDQLLGELSNAVRLTSRNMRYEFGEPTFNAVGDHTIGDEAARFTVTMTARIEGDGFSENQVRSLMASALDSEIGPGLERTNDPIHFSYDIDEITPNGDVRLTGVVIGLVIPRVSTDSIRKRIAGMTVDKARQELAAAFPGARIQLSTWPVASPWLPVTPSHITFKFGAMPLA